MIDRGRLKGTICDRMRCLIRESGEGQTELAEKVGINITTMKRIVESDLIPRTTTVIKFANYFGVRVDWILGRCEDDEKAAKPGRKTEPGQERMAAQERLEELLVRNEMNPGDLARELEVSYCAVYSAYIGYALSDPWLQIGYAEYFGVTVDWLLGMEE